MQSGHSYKQRCQGSNHAHLEFGYAGIWDLLTRHLCYSNAAASRRYKAMKCARSHPEVLRMHRKRKVEELLSDSAGASSS